MDSSRSRARFAALTLSLGCLVLLAAWFWLSRSHTTSLPQQISGTVAAADGPIAGAIVQIQGTPQRTTTAENGAFAFESISGTQPITVTAWADGYYVGWAQVDPRAPERQDGDGLQITLKPLFTTDNTAYPGFSFDGVSGSGSCGLCHREYAEWSADAHSQAAANVRFLTVYEGTNVEGDRGQLSRMGSDGKYLPPDPAQPYYGPGYKLDNPSRAGNCASCHTPLAGKIPNRVNCGWSGCHTDLTAERSKGTVDPGVSPLQLTGEAAEGVSCDFCHKVGDVILDPETGLPHADRPGILSMQLYRPPDGAQVFFGTLLDVTRRVSYSPLEAKSEFCAPCHYGVFGGVVGDGQVTGGTLIYNSYGEWLDSPYSDPETGKTCQDCHMPVLDTDISVFPERGGIARDYAAFHDHTMPGASDEQFLKEAVTMRSTARHGGDQLQVEVEITNDNTGHHIPTDAPLREMILVVEALDKTGRPLTLSQGPVLPAWSGDYAGQPGKMFSKVLRDKLSGEMPTAAYWRPVEIVQDTRLAALATDTTRYTFDLPAGNAAQVRVRLVFRRANQALMRIKGWTDPDIAMQEAAIQVEK